MLANRTPNSCTFCFSPRAHACVMYTYIGIYLFVVLRVRARSGGACAVECFIDLRVWCLIRLTSRIAALTLAFSRLVAARMYFSARCTRFAPVCGCLCSLSRLLLYILWDTQSRYN